MARSSDITSIYEAKKILEERLTCAGCSNILVEPRVLSCMHSFCFNCVQSFQVQVTENGDTSTVYICCPACESQTDFPPNCETHAASLAPAFHLIAMLELYKIVHKVQKGDKTSCENCRDSSAVGYCKHCMQLLCRNCITIHHRWSKFEKHEILGTHEIANQAIQGLPLKSPSEMKCLEHDEQLLFVCSTCDEIICQSCTVHEHREHCFHLISEVYSRHEDDIRSSLKPLKEQIDRLKEAVAMISDRENEIFELVNQKMSQTKQTAQYVIQSVQEAEENFYAQSQKICHQKLEALSYQKAELRTVLDDLMRCQTHVEEELRVASSQQILSTKSKMINAIKNIHSRFKMDNLSPKQLADICSAPMDEVIEKCQDIAKVAEAQIAGVQIINKGSLVGVVGKEVQFNIRVKTNPPGFLIVPKSVACSFSCADDQEKAIQCRVEKNSSMSYCVFYLPPDSKTRHLKVDIDGEMHFQIPFTVHIVGIPQLKDCLKTGLTKPWGVSFNNLGQIIATDFETHQVKIFNNRGHLLKSIGQRGKGKVHFKSPAGVAVNQKNEIVVVECENHRVQIISDHGDFVKFVGENGRNPLQFSFPYDVAVSRSGLIFISDSYNHRIQVLNSDLTFAGMFGSEGTQPGQFKNPIGIAIDQFERVYIADSGNERIQVFSLAGDFIQEFGKEKLTIPSGITVDSNNIVFVTDTGIGEVALFDMFGNFLGNFVSQSEELKRPIGITIGKGNVVYVCDWGVNDILTLH